MKKTVLKRVGAFLAVFVALLALAVVPAFASYDVTTVDDSRLSAITESFLSGASLNPAGSLLLNRGSSPTAQRNFFSYSYLLSGGILRGVDEIYKPLPPAELSTPDENADFSLLTELTMSVVYGSYTDYQTKLYENVVSRYTCSYSSQYGYIIELRIDIEEGTDSFVYASTDITRPLNSIALRSYTIDGQEMSPDSSTIYIGVLLDETSTPMLGALSRMFFGERGGVVQYPNSYFEILDRSEFVSDTYEKGYEAGVEQGYNQGYGSGVASTDAYKQGYNKATRDINSGDFGRNFLGSIFSAPFDALNSFKLVEWTTANGTVISVTLVTIFSAFVGVTLFVWFLKMFAGG